MVYEIKPSIAILFPHVGHNVDPMLIYDVVSTLVNVDSVKNNYLNKTIINFIEFKIIGM